MQPAYYEAMAAVVRRPDLWLVAIGQWRRMVPARWWLRRPHLPVPDAQYLSFRFETHFGPATAARSDVAHAVVAYLEWCQSWHRGGARKQ